MTNTIKHFKYRDTEYPLAFTMNVIEKLQDKYGSYEKWGEMTDGKEQEINIGALKFGITEMINEGIDMENETLETKREIITEIGMEKMTDRVQQTVIESTKRNEEEKNV